MTTERLKEFYDRKYGASAFMPRVLRPKAISTTRYDDVSRILPRGTEQMSVLEIGCNSGELLFALAARFHRLTGFDLCEQRIALAIRMLHERYPQYANKMGFRQADADSRFPFEDASFDVVIAVAMLEHVVDVYSVMDEIARVCRAGGCAILTVPNICYVKNIFTLLRGHLPSTGGPTSDVRMWRQYGWDGYHLHYFSKPALKTLLEETGFTPEIWTGSGRWAKLRRWCTNLVGDMTVRALRRAVGKPALP